MTDTDTPIQTWQYDAGSGVAAVALSADGETVIAGTLGKTVLCLDSAGQLRWQARVGNQAWRVGLSADGQTIIVGTGSTRPWDMSVRGVFCLAADGSLRWQVDLKASVWGLALAADGQTIAVGTSGKQLLLFDGQGNQLWQEAIRGLSWYAWAFGAALSADGELVAAAAGDKRVRLLDRNGRFLADHRTRGDVYIVALSANGEAIATGDTQGYVYWLDREGHLLWEDHLSDKIWAVALSADGERLLVEAGEREKHLHAYDRAGRMLWRRHVEGRINSLALSANGQRIIAGTREGGIHLFDEAANVLSQTRAGKLIRQVAISATGEYTVAGSEDHFVYGYRLPSASEATQKPAIVDQPAPQTAGSIYNIHIHQASGLAIGDQAQVIRGSSPPSSLLPGDSPSTARVGRPGFSPADKPGDQPGSVCMDLPSASDDPKAMDDRRRLYNDVAALKQKITPEQMIKVLGTVYEAYIEGNEVFEVTSEIETAWGFDGWLSANVAKYLVGLGYLIDRTPSCENVAFRKLSLTKEGCEWHRKMTGNVFADSPDDRATARRSLLDDAFSEEALTIFCFDHYPAVYRRFSAGMRKRQKIQRLLAYCESQGQVNDLVIQVQAHRSTPEPRGEREPTVSLPSPPQPPQAPQRCADLAENIRETLALIKGYEDQRRLTSDPKEKRRAECEIADLREQLSEYEAEARELGCE